MVEQTNKLTGTDIDGSPTPHIPGGPETPFDRTMRLDRAIAEGDLSVPSHFGRYEVLNRIGIGGFASVFSARDPELDSPVAIKVLAENHSADVEVRKRFVAEARVARRLGGDRLIDVFDLGETDDGRPFVVMELATGGTLRARLSRIGRPSPESLLRLIDELGACMIAIHGKNVVHRDIKPSNLLLRTIDPDIDERPSELIENHERLVLADFGLARDISAGASAVTVGGGTAGYMAPEQADPEGKADFRADIYAATVVLAELTTGRHPERLDLGSANLTTAVMEALEQGLSIDREQRPSSAEAWRGRLLHAYRSGGPYAQGSGPAPELHGSSMATRFDLHSTDHGSAATDQSADQRTAQQHGNKAGDDEGATNVLPTANAQQSTDATNLIDATAIIDNDNGPGPNRSEGSTEVQFDSALIDSALSVGEGLEPRTFVEPPAQDGPPPPPPSIPLSPRVQRPAPNKAPPRRIAPETVPVQPVGDASGNVARPSAQAPETVPVQQVPSAPETVPVPQVPTQQVPVQQVPVQQVPAQPVPRSTPIEPAVARQVPQQAPAPIVDRRPPPPRQPTPASPPASRRPVPQQQPPARRQPQSRPVNEAAPPGSGPQRTFGHPKPASANPVPVQRPPVAPTPVRPNTAGPGLTPRPAGQPPTPAGPGLLEPPSKRQAKQQDKVVRKDARKRRRRRRRRRISNFIRAIIRAVLSAVLTLLIGSIVAVAASDGSDVDSLSTEAQTIVQLAGFIAFFIGMRYFPWPRKLDPNG